MSECTFAGAAYDPPAMTDLEAGVRTVVHQSLGVRAGEEVVVVVDPATRNIGEALRAEAAAAGVHVAFGASAGIGGTVSVPIHLDVVVLEASLEVDGRRVLDAGRYVIDQ